MERRCHNLNKDTAVMFGCSTFRFSKGAVVASQNCRPTNGQRVFSCYDLGVGEGLFHRFPIPLKT